MKSSKFRIIKDFFGRSRLDKAVIVEQNDRILSISLKNFQRGNFLVLNEISDRLRALCELQGLSYSEDIRKINNFDVIVSITIDA